MHNRRSFGIIMVKTRYCFIFWLILVFIVLIGLISAHYLFERSALHTSNSQKFYNIFLFLALAIICMLGFHSWKKFGDGWQHKVWLIFYAFSIGLLGMLILIMRLAHLFGYTISFQLRHCKIFLLTPFPYIIIYLLTVTQNAQKLNKN